ncbi:type ISP restriction/modification enzyme [Microcystis flos-aquae]
MTIQNILKEFREAATSKRDMGDKFERLVLAYLKNDPMYKDRFRNVWLWMEWPKRNNKPDTGIDLIAEEEATGDIWAVQCKFYDPYHTLEKQDIDSFFTASGKSPFTKRMIVSTTDRWSKNAEDAILNQNPPVTRLRVEDLADSPIDWNQFSLKRPQKVNLRPKKQLRPHQIDALNKVMAGFETSDRGKLIMACGTGKTFTALKIAEQFASQNGQILFLVPSISLLSQTLREWTAEATVSLHSVAVCSDTKAGKRKAEQSDTDDIHAYDLALPPTTEAKTIAARVQLLAGKRDLTVIFSTYQSIQAIADAQKLGLPEFDLIICDEAHRTTGVTLSGDDESHFQKVHDQKFILGKKRLYMTATPKLYGETAKVKAKENDAVICSMDDEGYYGPEFHRLGFYQAVSSGLLTDYKVMVLAVDEKYVSATFQRQLADSNNELNLKDAVKIIGCWNGLSKRMASDADGQAISEDLAPMRRAVAFSRSIKESERIKSLFSEIIDEYRRTHPDEDILHCEVDHVDGTHNTLERHRKLDWLKEDTEANVCRILSNARCLSEGVDVPALDAVIFLTPRNSIVDVVQSVGRVMRKAEGKKYGYIILPIGIPTDMTPEEALKDNDKYKVVWQVLQALRAHDDRFNAIVNQIELNKARPPEINIIGVGGRSKDSNSVSGNTSPKVTQLNINFPNLEEWKDAIFAKIVLKCGDRRYWEDWAKDVATIAEGHISRIKALLESAETQHREAFDEFLAELRENLNPNVSEDEAIEMLSQHLITKPVFDALFEGYKFTELNPVSVAMQKMLDTLETQSFQKDRVTLNKFYESVKKEVGGIDNTQGKQKIIVKLYDEFFRSAFPRMTERLGIVYTPVEVVDFIVNSADQALKQEFGVGLTDEGVHILDPFTGTGTFIVRLLQSGLIKPEDLERKFTKELHANEIVLLAYYIAAINIEETYHGLHGGEYQPFNGIVLTDTFQMFENDGYLLEKIFPENNQRVINQKSRDITVIIGNPPYSAKQESTNDNNQNLKYEKLDEQIENSYAKYSAAQLQRNLYGSEIRSLRWASDRIKNNGIVCYVINGNFIDSNYADGLRKCLIDEFSSIYCFNLRGNQRTSGETSRQEGGKIFGSGSRASIAVILLIKNPEKTGDCQLFYHDIGDYLTREQKLSVIQQFGAISAIQWQKITPNKSYDWINQRNDIFESFISLGDKKDKTTKTIFDVCSSGIVTSRDTWVYNFSYKNVSTNISRMINFYNEQVSKYLIFCSNSDTKKIEPDKIIGNDPKSISWSANLQKNAIKGMKYSYEEESIRQCCYRPYCKQWLYFDKNFNERPGQTLKLFPNETIENLVIITTGVGSQKDVSVLITNTITDYHFQHNGQCFPLYTHEKQEKTDQTSLFTETEGYTRKENISNSILTDFQNTYTDRTLTKEDIFYYVYGILHSPKYKTRFAADLKKMLPRIPYAQDFWAFSKAGRELAYWHLNYETIEPYPLNEYQDLLYLDEKEYRVEKMIFGKRNKDKTMIIYNSHINLSDIPLEAYDYIVNGKSAIEWIMERYQITKDKDSGIVNDPNDWSDDPRYIIDLVKRIVRVSLETVKIVNSLPPLNERSPS